MRPNLPFLLATSNAILKPGGRLKWKKWLEKDIKAFAANHRSDEDGQAYISTSQCSSCVITKAKADGR